MKGLHPVATSLGTPVQSDVIQNNCSGNSIIYFSTDVIVSDVVLPDCIISGGVSNILPPSVM